MKRYLSRTLATTTLGAIFLCSSVFAMGNGTGNQETAGESVNGDTDIPQTLVKEARASIDRGVHFLLDNQKENGSWRNMASMTGLAVIALHGSDSERYEQEVTAAVEKGRKYILSKVRDNGIIAGKRAKYTNYSTSICLTALATLNRTEDRDVMRKARHFLIDMQLDEDHPQYTVPEDSPAYGGWAYGSGEPQKADPNMSTTQLAIEALYLTQYLDSEEAGADPEAIKKSELAWGKARDFLKDVQDLPKDADAKWVANKLDKDTKYDGGFAYAPEESKVNEKLRQQGQENIQGGLRSYGSMTYAGLKSMVYAKMDKDDPRVQAATQWARKHYTLDENPVMGPEGHYYYLLTFAKGFAALDKEKIKTAEGNTRRWRIDLIKKLLELQQGDGQWVNERHGRWMESIPELVTSYSLTAMEIALGDQLEERR